MTGDTVGGVWTYAVDLACGLERHGVQVMLLAMGGVPDEAQQQQAARVRNLIVIPRDYRLEWMTDCEADLIRSGDLLLRLEDEFQPDLVHINGYWHARLRHSAPLLVAAHSCVSSWWEACRGDALPPEWSKYRSWLRDAAAAADLLVAPTAAYLADFRKHHGAPNRSRVIWNGRDPTGLAPGRKQDLVLAAGRIWDEAKNIRVLCRAARGLGLNVAIAGDPTGPHGETVPLDGAQLLGRLTPEELARRMAEASIFVAPARYEPFGLTILEAGLSGCALVLGNIASLRELWQGAAIFVDPDDEKQLAHVLTTLSRDSQTMAELGARAHSRAKTYSIERMADAYVQAYSDVVSQHVEAAA